MTDCVVLTEFIKNGAQKRRFPINSTNRNQCSTLVFNSAPVFSTNSSFVTPSASSTSAQAARCHVYHTEVGDDAADHPDAG